MRMQIAFTFAASICELKWRINCVTIKEIVEAIHVSRYMKQSTVSSAIFNL